MGKTRRKKGKGIEKYSGKLKEKEGKRCGEIKWERKGERKEKRNKGKEK